LIKSVAFSNDAVCHFAQNISFREFYAPEIMTTLTGVEREALNKSFYYYYYYYYYYIIVVVTINYY